MRRSHSGHDRPLNDIMNILDFPIVRQSTMDTCSCACVQSCLGYYGFNLREGQIRNLMHVQRNDQEIHPRKIVKAFKHFGLKSVYRKLTLNELMEYVDAETPVIINLQAWYRSKHPDFSQDNNGHYAVAIGYDRVKSRIIFSDPASFFKTYLSFEELEKRWHDGDKTDWDYDHMGVVVFGKKSYSSEKIIRMK